MIENENDTTTDPIEDTVSDVADKLHDIQDAVTNYAKENPLQVIGISLLTGVLLAQFFRKRK